MERHRLRFRRTTLLILLFGSSVVGVALAPRTSMTVSVFTLLCVAVLLASIGRRKGIAAALMCVVLGMSIGLFRGHEYVQQRRIYESLYDQKVTLLVRAANDATYNQYRSLTFDARNVTLPDGTELPGKISVSGFGENAIFEGDELRLTGTFKATLGAAQGRMSFAEIERIAHHPSYIHEFRRTFAAGVQSALPEPLNSFVLGLLTGQRSTLPQDVKETLQVVGLTHIIAVSGYNMTIMLRASKQSLGRFSKRLAIGASLALMLVFLCITGMSASIVRAAIVSGLSLLAAYYGREFRPLLLILMAASITALYNPFYVWFDAGWYLSFLAFAGVMILAPLLTARMPQWFQNSTLCMIALESLAAEIATLPYLLHVFGQMTMVGLLANVLIVVFIPFAMLFGLIAGLAGMIVASFAGWFSWPAILVLTYMLDTSELLSRIPQAFHEGIYLSTASMWQIYGIVILFTAVLNFRTKLGNGILTDKNGVQLTPIERIRTL